MKRAELVDRASLRTVWPAVEPFVSRALSKAPTDYISADVFAALLSGQATLYVTKSDDGEPTGCFVLRIIEQWAVRELYVWILAHENPDHGVIEYLDWLEGLAREAQCKRWACDSPRRFDKLVPGLKMTHYHFYKEV